MAAPRDLSPANGDANAHMNAYPQSYYAASKNAAPERPALQGEHAFDICVVGAGYSGLSTALHLAEKGYNVSIVEGLQVGWGASGRNGGQIVNGLNAGLDTITARYGEETAAHIGPWMQEGNRIIRDWVTRYEIDCDFKEKNLFTAYNQRHMRGFEAKQALWRKHGMDDHEMIDREGVRQHVGTDAYCGGMMDHSGAHLHPLNLALGEARAFEQNGGTIFEMSEVTGLEMQGPHKKVKTATGTITCKTIILCGNAYLGYLVPELENRVMPVSTQIIATEPLGDALAKQLLPTDVCVEDARYILDYFRLSGDKRMLFGGGLVYGGTDPADVAAKLRPNMEKVFPVLKEKTIDYAWSGNFALSFARVPQMGRLTDNVYFAHGYSGHGVTGSHLFGRILSEAIHGDLTRFDVFEKLPWVAFPGGRSFRVPYSVIGSWWYALRDALGL